MVSQKVHELEATLLKEGSGQFEKSTSTQKHGNCVDGG